ncbi:MAG: PIN domain-containing protein [Bryobacteraceae bacterium]
MILLDTNTIIYYLKGVETVVARLHAASRHEVAIPSLTVYEIEYGNRKTASRRRAIVSALLAALTQVPFDFEAAQEAARIRIDLEARGLVIGPIDLLIAGTAVSRGAVLATSNTREFSRVKHLRLIDWTR